DLSVLVPVYNERRTIGRVLTALRRVAPRAEIIAIDDGSTDGSDRVLAAWGRRGIRVVTHPENRGKGSAIRTGLARARRALVVIQDADLETDPRDLPSLLAPLARGARVAVFGTRFPPGRRRRRAGRLTRAVNRLITGTVNGLFGASLSDVACAYKAAPASLLRSLDLRARRFELE